MKKIVFLTLLLFLTICTWPSQQEMPAPKKEPKKTYAITRAYAYQEESLLISDSDNNCTFFIRQEPVPEDITIVGAQNADDLQSEYAQYDKMYINCGSQNGLKEGDVLMIIGKGPRIRHPYIRGKRGKLGRYYLKRGLATITCIYEDRAIITLQDTCNPIKIGDIAIPFRPEKTIWQKKLIYSLCRIPPTPLEGMVIYEDIYMDLPRSIAMTSSFVAVDLGEGLVEKGTFLLFYRIMREDLPPFIIGMGIVVHTENNNSTVKILDCYSDIREGDRAAVLAGTNELKVDTERIEVAKKEEIPIVETLSKEAEAKKEKEEAVKKTGEEKAEPGKEEKLMIDLFFDFDSRATPANTNAELEKVANFVSAKSEYIIILRGYCCSIGNDEYNLKLSQERVEAVKSLLATQFKIDPSHIETYFYGEKDPLFDNSQESERKKNRLVKLEVVGK